MATYTYETIPQNSGEKPRRFEIQQSMKEDPLIRDPKTGESVRRVISGGLGYISHSNDKTSAPSSNSHGCGSGCGCHH
jgi:predicted nucleic acid-binding Zn ribbon protein